MYFAKKNHTKTKLKSLIMPVLLSLTLILVSCNPANTGTDSSTVKSVGAETNTTVTVSSESGNTSLSNSPAQAERFRGQFLGVFDTVTTVIALTDSETEFQAYLDEIKNRLTHYHQLFDSFNNYEGVNNIKTINDQAGLAPVKVDPAIIQLLEQCIEANRLSKGYVNVAFGPVLEIWHDYREAGIDQPQLAKLPALSELEEADQYTDIDKIQIDKAQSTVFLPDSHMSLDVGSGAKGLGCELVAQELEEKGLKNALISVGGNVRAIGYRDGKAEAWNVGIQDPADSTNSEYIRLVRVHDMAVVSSGVYERYYDVDGVRYHHIIHPETLFPKFEFDAVTIIAPSSGFADSLTTALFNMSFEEGLTFIDSLDGVAALWIKGEEVRYSKLMTNYISE